MNLKFATRIAAVLIVGVAFGLNGFAHSVKEGPDAQNSNEMRFVQFAAKNKFDRSKIADLGSTIEFTRSDSVWGFATREMIEEAKAQGIEVLGDFEMSVGRGGHMQALDFPAKDSKFHNYKELDLAMKKLETDNPGMVKLRTIGKSLEGRDITAIHINSDADSLKTGLSGKPGIVFMGTHHAREHVSTEMPLLFAQYLLKNKMSKELGALMEKRDIWIIPMVNPDGVEHDIATGVYQSWRKNRRNNGNGTYGVDLNRNYGYMWGTGGSSKNSASDVYMGTEPFSEPETKAIKTFVDDRPNLSIMISFHTFSELILYPWGHKYAEIDNPKDITTFKAMAEKMATWNGYKPEQSSDLYIASGDTTDWAYGVHGIFAFTFELSPSSIFGGGFYPGQEIIDSVFEDNLKPCLYLLDLADDPYRASSAQPLAHLNLN